MQPRSLEREDSLVVDTSVIINLNATGQASRILQAIGRRVFITDIVVSELDNGRKNGRNDHEQLSLLIRGEIVEVVSIGEAGGRIYEELVVGMAADTLDDGEAGTIAYAVAHNAVPVIDERKANRICTQRFPHVSRASTMDLFANEQVKAALGSASLADALFAALQLARMQVLPHHIEFVRDTLGPERTALCRSLPRGARIG